MPQSCHHRRRRLGRRRPRRSAERGPRHLRPPAGGRSGLSVRRADARGHPHRLALRRDGPRLGLRVRRASSRPRRPSRASASRPRASCPFRAARSSAAPRPSTAAMRCAPTAATSTAGSAWATTTGRGTRSCPTSGARRTTPPAATGTAPAARCRSAASPARACARSCARSSTGARRPVTRSSRISTRRVPWARGRCPSTRSTAYGRARRSRISLPARRRANLEIRAGVTVDRVELIGGRARAVVLTSGERIDADVIVLAARRDRQPDDPAALRHRAGRGSSSASASRSCTRCEGVGRNLRDHPMLYPTWTTDADAVGALDPPLQAFLACSASGAACPGSDRSELRPVHPAAGRDPRRHGTRAALLHRASRARGGRPRRRAADLPQPLRSPGGPPADGHGRQDHPRRSWDPPPCNGTSATSCGPVPTPPATPPSRRRSLARPRPTRTSSEPARWGRRARTGRWSISAARCTGSRACTSSTPRSCRRSPPCRRT